MLLGDSLKHTTSLPPSFPWTMHPIRKIGEEFPIGIIYHDWQEIVDCYDSGFENGEVC